MKKKYLFIFSLILFFSLNSFSQNQNYINTKPDVPRLKFPDFKLYDIYSIYRNGNRYLKIQLGNLGYDYSGLLLFKIEYLGPNLSGKIAVSKNISIKSHKKEHLELIQLNNKVISCYGELVRITVDPNNNIVETNEKNNVHENKIYNYNVPNGEITYVQIPKTNRNLSRTHIPNVFTIYPRDIGKRDGDKVRIRFSVLLRNCGRKPIPQAKLISSYYYESDCGNSKGFILADNTPVYDNYGGCGLQEYVSLLLPLYIKSGKKVCKPKKLLVKIVYKTGEERKLMKDNIMIFQVRYPADIDSYR